MPPIRLRHPKGVTTLQVDLDHASVQDLQQQIFEVSEILPSQQESMYYVPSKSRTQTHFFVHSQIWVPTTIAHDYPRASTFQPGIKVRRSTDCESECIKPGARPSFPTQGKAGLLPVVSSLVVATEFGQLSVEQQWSRSCRYAKRRAGA